VIFVRCRAGISHIPLEFVSIEDMGLAIEALIETVEEITQLLERLKKIQAKVSSTGQNDWSAKMREIQASAAKTHFLKLLDDVERGESVLITRRGRAIARLVPEDAARKDEINRAKDGIRALRKRVGRMSLAEILAARDEGRR
jgi:prevent-host-death family protein